MNDTEIVDKFKPPYTLKEGLIRTIKYEFINKQNANEVLFYSEQIQHEYV